MIDFTNITQPVYKVFGNDTISFNGISTYNSNRVSRFIDSGTALYYFISNNQENYDRQYQITLLKLSYDMEYLDTWRTQEFSFVVTQDNTSYVYTEIASLNFVCKISNSEYFPETYPSSSFNFSQSPHVIFPRYYIRGDLNSWRGYSNMFPCRWYMLEPITFTPPHVPLYNFHKIYVANFLLSKICFANPT